MRDIEKKIIRHLYQAPKKICSEEIIEKYENLVKKGLTAKRNRYYSQRFRNWSQLTH